MADRNSLPVRLHVPARPRISFIFQELPHNAAAAGIVARDLRSARGQCR